MVFYEKDQPPPKTDFEWKDLATQVMESDTMGKMGDFWLCVCGEVNNDTYKV